MNASLYDFSFLMTGRFAGKILVWPKHGLFIRTGPSTFTQRNLLELEKMQLGNVNNVNIEYPPTGFET